MEELKPPKRCEKCKKILREHNKSGLCHYHSIAKHMKKRRDREREI